MAVLKVVKGSCPGQLVELHGERMIMGRHPNCHIVLDNAAVSRNHAQILESHGSYYLEDLRSRNGTILNGQRIRGRSELHDNDEVRVCDVVFTFHLGVPIDTDSPPPPLLERATAALAGALPLGSLSGTTSGQVLEDDAGDSSSIISSIDLDTASPRISVRPDVKLRAVLEISRHLAHSLDLDVVLPRLLDSLFRIFPQADRGFVVLRDAETEELQLRAVHNRGSDEERGSSLSMTILREAMQSKRALLSADAAGDRRFRQAESVANLRIRSLMCAPLVPQEGEPLGAIQIDTFDFRQQFSQDDLDLLVSVAAQAALVVENAKLHGTAMRQRDFERELEFATQVQLGFLPTERPRLSEYQFFDFYEAAYRVGGDFFDYVPLPDGRVTVALGDVAGKGIAAALLMARLYSAARFELLTKATPAEAMSGLNETLCSSGLGHRFVTLVFLVIDPARHVITLVNAGHMAPLMRRPGGDLERLGEDISGLPLGIRTGTQYQQVEIPLVPGDIILLFTDGVTEAMNNANELYGFQRLQRFLMRAPEEVEVLGEALVEDVERFCDGRPQRDDICLIAFRRLPDI